MNNIDLGINLAPLISTPALWVLVFIITGLLLASAILFKRGLVLRTITALLFVVFIVNPSLIREEKRPVTDQAVIIVDNSYSQSFGDRAQRRDKALEDVKAKLTNAENIDFRVIQSHRDSKDAFTKTDLYKHLEQALLEIPAKQRAGAIIISDGQIHDIPNSLEGLENTGPIHLLLTGEKDERDRQLVIHEAPSYGIVDQTVKVRFEVKDSGRNRLDSKYATITIKNDDGKVASQTVEINKEQSVTLDINHAGQNIFDLEVESVGEEITYANNRVPLIINGVRDRLRVLLVSGQPHAGGRTWRNLLTSDPGVDLVHFTILREPHKLDTTPQNELSLIAFPFQELFEIKLYDFDLIIFDQYKLNRILPSYYFSNIAKYVREGGALLVASGPSFASSDSIYNTDLGDVLPAPPNGSVIEQAYKPLVTDKGYRHPVTQDLLPPNITSEDDIKWGSWLRQISVSPVKGDVVMTGHGQQPLLILDRVDNGRVAQLASDHIWLWSRGYDGGGPQTEIMRRLAHWLMKEPELEENALEVSSFNQKLFIKRRSLTADPMDVIVKSPEGNEEIVSLTNSPQGFLQAEAKARELGIYVVDDGSQQKFALVGDINPPELTDVLTSPEKMAPLIEKSGGSHYWLDGKGTPKIRSMSSARRMFGNNWLGLRQNNSFDTLDVKVIPLLPAWLVLSILSLALISSWWFEGRKK